MLTFAYNAANVTLLWLKKWLAKLIGRLANQSPSTIVIMEHMNGQQVIVGREKNITLTGRIDHVQPQT